MSEYRSRIGTIAPLATLAALAIVIAACSQQQESRKPPSNVPILFVDADGSNPSMARDTSRNPFPHLMFEDSSLSINDRCPVRKVGLNRRLQALLVNGRPLGFC